MITVGHGGLCGWQSGVAQAGQGADAATSLAGRPGRTQADTGAQWESEAHVGPSLCLL